MLTAAAGRLAVALVMMLLALQPASAGSTVKLCGGRSVTVPLLGTYAFQVTAVYQDEKFGFRCDGDLHVANCFGNTVAPATGQVLQAAPCLTQLLEKYSLTDLVMDVSNMPEKVRLSATASPMGYAFGTMGLELSQAACPKDEL